MLRGIESAKQGMIGALDLNDAIANNLSNVNSTGFKQQKLVFKNIQETAVENINSGYYVNAENKGQASLSLGSSVDAVVTDFRQGGINSTGNPYDVALNGDGFFKVEMENGEEAYTRNGSFILQQDGRLTTLDGRAVLGEKGPIVVNVEEIESNEIHIGSDGSLQVGAEIKDKLAIVDFEDKTDLKAIGSAMFLPKNPEENLPIEANATVVQGALESSNANVIESMVNSIAASRTYETLNNIVQTHSKTLEKNINQVGQLKR